MASVGQWLIYLAKVHERCSSSEATSERSQSPKHSFEIKLGRDAV